MTRVDSLIPDPRGDLLIPLRAMINEHISEILVEPPLKQRRDTAEGCRDRATSSRQHAGTMASTSDRKLLEDSAESWTARADLLQRLENADEALLNLPVPPLWTGNTHAKLPSIAATPVLPNGRSPL